MRFADEEKKTRRVEDVQLLAHPPAMQQRSLRGNLVVLFADVIIRIRGPLRDVAHAPDDARAREHPLAERCLPGRRVTHDGKIAKIPRRRRGHKLNPLLSRPLIRRGRKLKSSARCAFDNVPRPRSCQSVRAGNTISMMKTISLKLPAPLANWLAKRANELGRSRSDMVRQALEEQRQGKNNRGEKSCAELMAEFGGFFRGPRDLSTNPKYMRDLGK